MPRRCSVGARLRSTGWSLMTSSRMSQTTGSWRSTISLAALMVVQWGLLQLVVNEWLEKLEGHLFGQTALMELEFRPHDNHGATGVIDALAEQVLAEAALFPFQCV